MSIRYGLISLLEWELCPYVITCTVSVLNVYTLQKREKSLHVITISVVLTKTNVVQRVFSFRPCYEGFRIQSGRFRLHVILYPVFLSHSLM